MLKYKEKDHGTFDEEWDIHKKITGWWYITGYLKDDNDSLYSYQYTALRFRIFGINLTVLQLALTDFQTKKHYYKQNFKLFGKKHFKGDLIKFSKKVYLQKNEKNMLLNVETDDFSFELNLDKGKGAFWHGDNGVLVMGLPEDPKQRTVYYSYPNMPTTGELTIKDKTNIKVVGKSWFDRQWGPYSFMESKTHWEWFSLRFFDEEEVMLFSFPQNNNGDGTYINKENKRVNVKNYTIKEKELIKINDFTFSKGWNITMPGIKEETYTIKPLMDGQMNLAYFELLAEIINKEGKSVGLCFVELLPGVRNPNMKQDFKNLIKKV